MPDLPWVKLRSPASSWIMPISWTRTPASSRPGKGFKTQYGCLAPPRGQTICKPKPSGRKSFATLAESQAAAGQETHGVEVDFDIFERMAPPNPARPYAVCHAMDLNFQLKPGSKAADAGVVVRTVHDGTTGKAPDPGAHEAGAPPLRCGPRWLNSQPFHR